MASGPAFNFEYDSSLEEFAVPKQAYLVARPDASFDRIATSALVLDTHELSQARVLLLQRAPGDSKPNKWEPPGGACDDEDPSILHAAARELREEAGLEAVKFTGTVGEPDFFTIRHGKKICRIVFAVQVKTAGGTPAVKLNLEEHQNFVWATEDQVKAKNVDGMSIDFTSREVEERVLLAFKQVSGS